MAPWRSYDALPLSNMAARPLPFFFPGLPARNSLVPPVILSPPYNVTRRRAGMLLLGSELPQDMDSQALVIRIRIPDGGAVDWTVQPATQLLFRDILDVIGQVLPDATTTAFEYEDENGDRITVRSDEEMKAMLSYYCSMVLEQQGSSPQQSTHLLAHGELWEAREVIMMSSQSQTSKRW